MKLDVLTLAEPMIDIYHEPISQQRLKEIGLSPGSWNLYVAGDEECERVLERIEEIPVKKKVPGSSPGNLSFTMSTMGHSIGLITAIGDDENGALYRHQLNKYGIADYTQRIEGETNAFLHALFTDGERTFFAYTGATPQITLDGDFPDAQYLYFSGYETAKIGEKVLNLARRENYTLAFDPASPDVVNQNPSLFREVMEYSKILFASHEEYGALAGKPFNEKHPLEDFPGLEILVLKEGAKGSRVISKDHDIYVPPAEIPDEEFCNTNGAGDAYAAGFLSALLKGETLETAAYYASRTAAEVICREEPHIPIHE